MITFLSSPEGVAGCDRYLAKRGRRLAPHMKAVPYCDLTALASLPAGTSIFAAVDRLSPMHREAAADMWDQLSRAGQRLLNHPTRSLRRYELLRRLFESGRNRFQVFRGDESSKPARFPVFVREANRHTGSLTPLLDTRMALERAIALLTTRGFHPRHLLVVEYCDTRDSAGLVRKYAAFKVGDVVLAKSLMVGSHWMVKAGSRLPDGELDEERAREGHEYIHANPHEEWIREIFELAAIDYGRIDYGFCAGAPQVWEINTDPTLARTPHPPDPERERYRLVRKSGQDFFHRGFRAALRRLDGPGNGAAEIPISLVPELRQKLQAEIRRERMRRTVARAVRCLVSLPGVRRMERLLKPAAPTIAPLARRLPRLRAQ